MFGSGLEEVECAYRTIVRCTAFEGDWKALDRQIGICDPHDLIRHILVYPASWQAVVDFVKAVIGVKEEAGCARNRRLGEPRRASVVEVGYLRELLNGFINIWVY